MGLFLSNTGLEGLREGDGLHKKLVGELLALSKVEKVGDDGSAYATYTFPSGLSLVLRMGGDVVVDGDMHYEGGQIWQAKPIATIASRGFLSLDLILMDLSGKHGFAASIVKPATMSPFTSEDQLDLSVSAFPIGIDVFDDRKGYETATDEKIRLEDGAVIPYNWLMTKQEGLKAKELEFFTGKIQFNLLAGEVVSLQKRDNQWHGSSFMVATVRTVLGNLPVVFSEERIQHPLAVGCYVFVEALISAKVLAIGGKTL